MSNEETVKNAVIKAIKTIVGEETEVKPEHYMANDLHMDSLDCVEAIMEIEDILSIYIPDEPIAQMGEDATVQQVIDHVTTLMKA